MMMIKEFGKVIIEKENITVTEFSFEGSNGLGGAGLEALLFAKEKIDAEIMDIFNRNIPRLTARIAELEDDLTDQSQKRIENANIFSNKIIMLEGKIRELEDAARWVSVEERLPEYGHYVLIRTIDTVVSRIGKYSPTVPQWSTTDGMYYHDISFGSVTHWMPLPDVPQDGDK
jgi:inhibitor of KinA sporulation pathway (predicted exonuclease)